MRLFVACDLPEPIRESLVGLEEALPGARWVGVGNLHLTLTFLGNVSIELTERVIERLARVRHGAFAVQAKGVGVFPGRGSPRVLFAGLEPAAPVVSLKAEIDRELEALGMEPERRPFHAHVTLARAKPSLERAAVDAYLARHRGLQSEPFSISEFVLYESQLSAAGSRYEARARFGLG